MRLIDADALRETMYHEAFEKDSVMQKWDSGCWIRYKLFEKCIDAAPSIEPKRGKWTTKKDECGIGYQICSNCETEIQWRDRHGVILRADMQNAPYCPNCGARMESE